MSYMTAPFPGAVPGVGPVDGDVVVAEAAAALAAPSAPLVLLGDHPYMTSAPKGGVEKLINFTTGMG